MPAMRVSRRLRAATSPAERRSAQRSSTLRIVSRAQAAASRPEGVSETCRTRRSETYVAIDWAFRCQLPLGHDLGQLLAGEVERGRMEPDAAARPARDRGAGYVDGLAVEGVDVTAATVRRGLVQLARAPDPAGDLPGRAPRRRDRRAGRVPSAPRGARAVGAGPGPGLTPLPPDGASCTDCGRTPESFRTNSPMGPGDLTTKRDGPRHDDWHRMGLVRRARRGDPVGRDRNVNGPWLESVRGRTSGDSDACCCCI